MDDDDDDDTIIFPLVRILLSFNHLDTNIKIVNPEVPPSQFRLNSLNKQNRSTKVSPDISGEHFWCVKPNY